MIPATDLAAQLRPLRAEIEAGLREVMDSGQFLQGRNVAALESELAAYLGVAHAVSCGSGTDALLLSLWGLGLGPGDEVITTPFTFFATMEAIMRTGARPVLADVDPRSFNLDAARVEEKVGPATRAILAVHLFGHPAPAAELSSIAADHGLALVEDCAQSFGATVDGRQSGAWGAAGCFSFFPSKNLGACGDGGLVCTGDDALAEQVRVLRNHGSSARHRHECLGHNSRLDEFQAVVLRAKLKHLEAYNRARRELAARYRRALSGLDQLVLPREQPGCRHVYNQYTVLVPDRDRVCRELQARDIHCAIHYPCPLNRQPFLEDTFRGQRFPVAEDISRRCLSLPIFPEMSAEQVDEVAEALKAALS